MKIYSNNRIFLIMQVDNTVKRQFATIYLSSCSFYTGLPERFIYKLRLTFSIAHHRTKNNYCCSCTCDNFQTKNLRFKNFFKFLNFLNYELFSFDKVLKTVISFTTSNNDEQNILPREPQKQILITNKLKRFLGCA